jgi:uncharacterized membrane protein YkvA (DUF1232 family)
MKRFDALLEDDIRTYEGRHDDLIYQAPALYRLLTRLLDEPSLPNRLRPLLMVAIAYFILPIDVIPEETYGPYGYADDIYFSVLVADRVRREMGCDEALLANWDGEAPLLPLLEDVLRHEADLIGDKLPLILRYVGYEHLGG